MRYYQIGILNIIILLTALTSVYAESPRFALIIGNSEYQNYPLANSVNNAQDVSKTLSNLGFDTILRTELNLSKMNVALQEFGELLRKTDGVGLFYFSGHGIQYQGRNYLVPLGAKITKTTDIENELFPFDSILEQFNRSDNHFNIIIIDSGYANPFESILNVPKGFAHISAPKGTIIAYSSSPGTVTYEDNSHRNSIYTKYLLKALHDLPHKSIEELFKYIRIQVMEETNKKQIPWESSFLTGDFYFSVQSVTTTPTAAPPTPKPTASPTPTATPKSTASPTPEPTASPTPKPTASPTPKPTASPTPEPTASPTSEPTAPPTPKPTASPMPALTPTPTPTSLPTASPTPSVVKITPTPSPTSLPDKILETTENTNISDNDKLGEIEVEYPVKMSPGSSNTVTVSIYIPELLASLEPIRTRKKISGTLFS